MTNPVPSKDLVAELRATNNRPDFAQIYLRHLAQRAADEIERLRRELEAAKAECIERFDQARHFAELSSGRARPEPAVTLTWDKFWQRVRESNWNPSPDDMRKILDGKIEHGASSDIPPCQAAEHGGPIMTLAECMEAEGGIPFQTMEASTEHEPKSDRCNALWLGCQLPPGHDGNHRCGAAVWSTSQPPGEAHPNSVNTVGIIKPPGDGPCA